ncbi:MAG: GNAT family N-acetyltransferase [Vicinamibacterales bacterium]|jgi:ribosomal protein S18 acetylase RimI-like enzyme
MDTLDPLALDVVVRNLNSADLDAVILLDAKNVGRRREEFFKLKLKQALSDTGITVSLAAEVKGAFVGFLLARVFYGEFGVTERVAVMDVIDVHPAFRGLHVATALLDQLRTNLVGLGIGVLRTEVGWENTELLGFFRREGFVMAQRVCLDLEVAATR